MSYDMPVVSKGLIEGYAIQYAAIIDSVMGKCSAHTTRTPTGLLLLQLISKIEET